jgi:tetratricopeptide (TPR) repeat protein
MQNRSLKRSSLLLAFAATFCLGPRAATAGGDTGTARPPAASSAAAEPGAAERAAALYREGNTLYDQNKHLEAEARYQAAWDIQRSFDVAGNLGNVELVVKQPREAAEHLSYAIEIFPLGEKPAKKAFLEERLAQAKAQIGTLKISVNVDGAEVLVDGRVVGRSPLQGEVFVDPGDRVIEARRGAERTTTSVVAAQGSSQSVSLSLASADEMNMGLVIAGGAVGLAGVASGVTFALLSSAKGDDAAAAQRGSAERADLRDSQTLLANVSFWSFVGGGVVLAGTAVYALLPMLSGSSAKPEPTGLRAAPLVTARGGGLVVGASF